MDIRQLRCFDAVLNTRAMTRAADLLGLAQPTVSVTIQQLEKEIGFTLFHRKKGWLEPTPEAYSFHKAAKDALDAVDRVTQTAHDINRLNQGQVSLLCYPGISWRFMPDLIAEFHKDYPGIQVKLVSKSSMSVRQVAMGQNHDIAIMETPVPSIKSVTKVFRLTCACMVHKDSPLAAKASLTPLDLHEVPFVTLFPDHSTNHLTRAAFIRYGASMTPTLECDYFISAANYVHHGLGVTIVDPITLSQLPPDLDIVVKPFKPDIIYEIAVLRVANPLHSKVSEEFYDRLIAALTALQKNPPTYG